jgi:hypothetical protein
MTAFLPSNLLALFAPRDAISYLPPMDKLGHQKKPWPYVGVSNLLAMFEVKQNAISNQSYSCIYILIPRNKICLPLEGLSFAKYFFIEQQRLN